MKKLMPLCASIMVILIAGIFASVGTMAVFSDTEKSIGNTITAGTLDLKVDGGDEPSVVHIEISNIAPGWSGRYSWRLRNAGSLPGKLYVEFSPIVNNENGVNEPEGYAEAQPYASPEGELGQYLKTSIMQGYGYPSLHIRGDWQTGPPHPWGTPGLNGFGGNRYAFKAQYEILDPGEEVDFYLIMELEGDLRAWSGTGWYDVDDNIIQSDSVAFDIIFYLEQA